MTPVCSWSFVNVGDKITYLSKDTKGEVKRSAKITEEIEFFEGGLRDHTIFDITEGPQQGRFDRYWNTSLSYGPLVQLSKCAEIPGAIQTMVSVPAGTFQTCKVTETTSDSTIETWYGDVPLNGIIKSYKKINNLNYVLETELISFSFGNP